MQKRRGGYYTPMRLARYLVEWGLQYHPRRILEPGAGDGNFLLALAEAASEDASLPLEVTAVEIIPEEAAKAQRRLRPYEHLLHVEWWIEDFFKVYPELRLKAPFDLVLGNPPFIRFQYFERESQERAFFHLQQAGYRPTKLANAWMAFVALSIELLGSGGNLAMVVPAEILQVKYAAELRERLSHTFSRITLITFDRLVFPAIQQEVVLLLAEDKVPFSVSAEIRTLEFRDGEALLKQLPHFHQEVGGRPKKMAQNGLKWTAFFLDEEAFQTLLATRQHPTLSPLGEWARVEVGIVTGRNAFFVLTHSQREALQAQDFTVPVVGRTGALQSLFFTLTDFEHYRQAHPAYLLHLAHVSPNDLPQPLQQYLALGEAEGVHQGYKCRIRERWFEVPSVYIPDGFLYRQIHRYPLLVANQAKATSTDTIHRVTLKIRNPEISIERLAVYFFNSLTFAWSEVLGRSYGGGVLELEPREALEIPLPHPTKVQVDIDPKRVDMLLRAKRFPEALEYADTVLLGQGMGLSPSTIRTLRRAWLTLRDRRLRRK